MANYQSTHTGAQIDEGIDKANKALVKPDSAPSATSLVAIDNTNAQTTLTIGDGLSVENGALKATGGGGGSGGGTQLYAHHIIIFNVGFDVEFTMYSTVSNAFTMDSWVQYLEPFRSLNVSGVFTDIEQNKSYPLIKIDAHPRVAYILNDEEVPELIDATKFDDTVTPL